MGRIRFPVRAGAAAVLLGLLACEPVFAIGWEELVIIILLVIFLLWPFLLKLARIWIKFQELQKKKKD